MKELCYRSVGISGEAGSGKSTLAANLAQELSAISGEEWEFFGAGQLFRDYQARMGRDSIAASAGEDEQHNIIDSEMARVLEEGSAIAEGRVAVLAADANNVEGVLKVKLSCEARERHRRIYVRDGYKYSSIAQAALVTESRESDNRRIFAERYGGKDYLDDRHYDVGIDTTTLMPEETLQLMLWVMGIVELNEGFEAFEVEDNSVPDGEVMWIVGGIIELNYMLTESLVSVRRR